MNVPAIDSADVAVAPVGGFITPWYASSIHSIASAGCKGTLYMYRQAMANFFYLTGPAASGATVTDNGVTYDVYPTSVPGIGYVLGFASYCTPGVYQAMKPGAPPAPAAPIIGNGNACASPQTPSFNVVDQAYFTSISAGGNTLQPTNVNLQVRFVKTAASPGTGAITGNLASMCVYSYGNSSNLPTEPDPSNPAGGPYYFGNYNPNVVACGTSLTVGASVLPITCDFGVGGLNRNITLPTIASSALTGVGSTAAGAQFSLNVTCLNAT
ncbi:hypothetical protein, partial [Paraburkholderia dilworthii]|uniref:hypothetical protein n=1 Tax=Paraburkholderia dilworthii TaxID=948106 RepID=UPI00048330F1